MPTRQEYVEKIKEKIDDLDAKIDGLEAKVRAKTADMKEKYTDQIAELRGRRDKARQKLQEIIQANEGVWQEMKEGMGKAIDALKETYDKVKSRFD